MKRKFIILFGILYIAVCSILAMDSDSTINKELNDSNVIMMYNNLLLDSDWGMEAYQQGLPETEIFEGYTRRIPYRYSIPPYGLQITVKKTTHIIFPYPISYVDLGTEDIMASIAGDALNVLRVKASEYFPNETNMSVITEDGSFYTFNVQYYDEPLKIAIEMQNFLYDGDAYNRPNNSLDIYFKELNSENPKLVRLIMQTIANNNIRYIKHLGSRSFGVQYLMKGIYSHNNILYFFAELQNNTNVDYNIDYMSFTVADKNVVKRTTIQEQQIYPVRAYNYVTKVKARTKELVVWAFPIFTLPNNKILKFDMHEKNGGRHQIWQMDNTDLVRAREIKNLNIELQY